MNVTPLHTWNVTPREAIALQKQLAGNVVQQPLACKCELIAGADASYTRFSSIGYAAVVVLKTSDWSVVEAQHVVGKVAFPYVPGLLTFREAPLLMRAFKKLKHRPDAVMIDGQGRAHPRRLGLAAHVGLWLGIPTVGCAKSRLLGTFREPRFKAGSIAALMDKEEVIGSVVRTKDGVNPLFISVGNLIDLEGAVRLALSCCAGYRVPEPTRQAHIHVTEARRRYLVQAATAAKIDS
jgi:deoxyribonuclease V